MSPKRHRPIAGAPRAKDWRNSDNRRGSRQSRGYDEAWLKLAEQVRRDQRGLCQDCLRRGIVLVADGPIDPRTGKPRRPIVDHIIPIRTRPDLRLDSSNLQVLCVPCHARKTARETAKRPRD
jgi:5-methylcytosine-specific restriction enzyme A